MTIMVQNTANRESPIFGKTLKTSGHMYRGVAPIQFQKNLVSHQCFDHWHIFGWLNQTFRIKSPPIT